MTALHIWKPGDFVLGADINSNFAINAAAAAAAAAASLTLLASYGFKGDGVTDDAPALQALIAGTTGNVIISLPAGNVLLNSSIVTPGNRNVTISGAGRRATILTFGAGVAIGFNHGQAAPGVGVFSIGNLTILPTTPNVGTAIRVSVNCGTNPPAPGFTGRDLQLGGFGGAPCWNYGCDLYGCWDSTVANVCVFLAGASAAPTSTGIAYQAIEGLSVPANVTTQLVLQNYTVQNGAIGLGIYGNVQGITVGNSNFTGAQVGIKWVSTPNIGAGTLQVSNSQFNNAVRDIYMEAADNLIATGNLFLQFDQFVVHNWAAIELVNSHYPQITGNYILNPGGTVQSSVAAVIVRSTLAAGYAPGMIANNLFEVQNVAPVELRGSVVGTSVMNNDFWNVNPANPVNGRVLQTAAPAWTANTTYPAFSVMVLAGNTWTTVAGGTSGVTGPVVGGSHVDGTITWVQGGASLATYPNTVLSAFYGTGVVREDAGGNVVIGVSPPGIYVKVLDFLQGAAGMQSGSPGYDGLLDLFSKTTDGNNHDARVIVLNGTTGSIETGDLFLKAGSTTLQAPKLGFFSHAAQSQPTITGAKGGNAALASLITSLANLGLVIDSTT